MLGDFLSWLPKHREHLNIYVLKWDLGMIQALGRGMTPLFIVDWITDKRLHLKLDYAHPVGAAHHQKIVVIGDSLAFCGGIDMTADPWDTPEHLDDNPLRTKPSGRTYGPWHNATAAVDGDAARAILSSRAMAPRDRKSAAFYPTGADLCLTIYCRPWNMLMWQSPVRSLSWTTGRE